MSNRTGAAGAIQGVSVPVAGAVGTSVGVKASYTCPAGKSAMVRSISVANFTGAPTMQARATVGGVTVVLGSGTTQFNALEQVALNAGDSADVNCSATAVGSSVDILICAEEYSVL